jgi:hypothetical protein
MSPHVTDYLHSSAPHALDPQLRQHRFVGVKSSTGWIMSTTQSQPVVGPLPLTCEMGAVVTVVVPYRPSPWAPLTHAKYCASKSPVFGFAMNWD